MSELVMYEDWDHFTAVLFPFLVRCGAAAMCGGIVGIERELKKKPAGFRTNILICVGAAIYMMVGLLLVQESNVEADPARIAAQVVTGIGFLGAGAIIQQGSKVSGLTTAATIWVVAALGIVSGAGFPLLALVGAAMVVLTLVALRGVESRWLNGPGED